MPTPRRGEVWVDDQGESMLVISVDDFNRTQMHDVVCLGVYPGDQTSEEATPYADVISIDGEQWTVFFDDLFVARKDELADLRWAMPAELMADAEEALREVLTPTATGRPGIARPPRYPRTGEIRFADLHIAGEDAKPVVVISSEGYGRLVDHAFVVACRVSSSSARIRRYDVRLTSQIGKVVCSHVSTVKLADVTFRTTRGASHVSAAEAREIRQKVYALLGL